MSIRPGDEKQPDVMPDGGPVMVTIEPKPRDLGDNFFVRRALPAIEKRMVGPFIFWDEFGPTRFEAGKGMDVRPHPHINLATVTYLFTGAIEHRDSIGTLARIEPGAVNLMTAGRGIAHSERSPADERPKGPQLSGIQTWLALPTGKEEIDPAFEHVAKDRLPQIDGGGARVRVVMGTLWGQTSPVTCHSPTIYADLALQAGGSLPIDPVVDERGLYLAVGDAELDREPLQPMTMYVLRPGTGATLRSSGGAQVMLCGGAPLDGPRHVWWNFVSSRRERIAQAQDDWEAMRFPLVYGDTEERIPLPGVPLTVSYP